MSLAWIYSHSAIGTIVGEQPPVTCRRFLVIIVLQLLPSPVHSPLSTASLVQLEHVRKVEMCTRQLEIYTRCVRQIKYYQRPAKLTCCYPCCKLLQHIQFLSIATPSSRDQTASAGHGRYQLHPRSTCPCRRSLPETPSLSSVCSEDFRSSLRPRCQIPSYGHAGK